MLINVHILDIDVLSLHAFIANWRSYHTCYVVKLLSYQTTNWDLLQHKQTRMFKQPGLGCSKGCLLVPVQGFSSHLFRWFCFVFFGFRFKNKKLVWRFPWKTSSDSSKINIEILSPISIFCQTHSFILADPPYEKRHGGSTVLPYTAYRLLGKKYFCNTCPCTT